MVNTKNVMVCLNPEIHEKAKKCSKELFMKTNVSMFISMLIEKYEKSEK